MKKILFSFILFMLYVAPPSGGGGLYAQSVTIDPKNTATNIIDAKSTSQGMMVPKMSTAQKTAITNKTEGMMVYDTDAHQFSYWTGTVWVNFGNASSAGAVWSQTGDDIANTNPGNVTIATPTPNSYSKFEVSNSIASGNAIQGNSTGQYGIGIYGRQANGGFGVFGEATGTNAIGGYFVGNGSTGKALKAEIGNGGTAAFFTASGTNGKGLIVNQGNVGIGNLFPVEAKLVVDSDPSILTNAVFGSNGTGISLQKNWPGVGYNSYRDSQNNQRFIGTGYGMVTAVNQTNGTFFWNAMGSGSAGDFPDEQYIAGLNQEGDLDLTGRYKINNMAISPIALGVIDPLNGNAGSFWGGTYIVNNSGTENVNIELTLNATLTEKPFLFLQWGSGYGGQRINYNYNGNLNKVLITFYIPGGYKITGQYSCTGPGPCSSSNVTYKIPFFNLYNQENYFNSFSLIAYGK
jgi:hypothetical protein